MIAKFLNEMRLKLGFSMSDQFNMYLGCYLFLVFFCIRQVDDYLIGLADKIRGVSLTNGLHVPKQRTPEFNRFLTIR